MRLMRSIAVWGICTLALCAAARGQVLLSSRGTIVHTSNLGTNPPERFVGPGCRAEYNGDGVLNPDDVGDFITDYFSEPPIPGPGGYAQACPGGPCDHGYKCNYTSDGSAQCSPPFPDNLGDYITEYFADCVPMAFISPLQPFTSASAAMPSLQLPPGAIILSAGGPNTTAKAGLGTLTTPTALGVVFATGTGLTQGKNQCPSADTASTLEISFEASWRLTSQLGQTGAPPVLAGATLTLLGSLPPNPVPAGGCPPGSPAFARMDLAAQFAYTLPSGASGLMRPSIARSPFGQIATNCGPFTIGASDNSGISPSVLPVGTVITVSGTLTVSVHNDGDEARVDETMLTLTFQLCRADFNHDGVVNGADQTAFENAYYGQIPGPGGYAVPCPGLPPPFDQGYQADFDGNCQLNPDDLGSFITSYGSPCPPTFCPADFNMDGFVDANDVASFEDAFTNLTPGPGGFSDRCPIAPGFQADFNGDCFVDGSDMDDFIAAYFGGC